MIRHPRFRFLRAITAAFVLLASAGPAAAAAQETAAASMTLNDCIAQAVKRNLGVAVQVYTSQMADLAVSRSREKFLPTLGFDLGKQDQNSASFSWIDAADKVTTNYQNYGGSFSQAVPFGGNFSVALTGYRNLTNARFQTINPRFGSTLTFSFTQPLLKDFGWGISRKDILVARNSRDISESDFKRTLLDTVYSVEQTYWQLVLSIESLKVRRQSLKLAEDLFEQSRKRIQIGTLAPKEILTVQSDVASRKADILQAASLVKDYTDSLRALINSLDPTAGGGEEIAPADLPPFVKTEIGVEVAFAAALKNRPDLRSSTLGVRNKELDYAYARNQLLPQLNLSASYWSPGIGGDRILYLDNNPLTGIIVGTTPGGADMALRDTFGFKYNNWSVGLSLDVPLSSVFSRAMAAQAKAALDQEIARLKNSEQQAYLEVRTAVRAVQTNFERVDAYKAARGLAEEKLAAEQTKLEAGLTTTFVVLSYQRDVASAKLMELSALVDYTLSIARLEKAMGTSLEKKNIRLADAMEE